MHRYIPPAGRPLTELAERSLVVWRTAAARLRPLRTDAPPPVQTARPIGRLAPVYEVTVSQGHAHAKLTVNDLNGVEVNALNSDLLHAANERHCKHRNYTV